jgi:probable F420-dependent oxidoreductase
MRELVSAIKAIFASWQDGAPLQFEGEFFHHTYLPPMFRPRPLECGPPPIWVGAVGPVLTRTVAEVADGLLVHPFHSEAFLHDHTLPAIEEGRATADRRRDDFSLIADVIVCCGTDHQEQAAADAGVRMLLAFYGSTPAYAPVLARHGWGDAQPELAQLVRDGRWDDMPSVIHDDMLTTLSVRGTPDEVAAELVRRYDGVADRVGFYLPYQHDDQLASRIIRTIRAS